MRGMPASGYDGAGRPDRRPEAGATAITIRIGDDARDVADWLRRSWGGTTMVVHGRCYDLAALPAIVAQDGSDVVGALTYTVTGDELEIVSCDADPPRHGVGRALVAAAVKLARTAELRRVWCTTTNDNLVALGFWQALGFALVALRPDAVADARRLKPSIPLRGHAGLPIRDELDLQLRLDRVEPPARTIP
jgi:ribosomal protein S18 acetylase RimI-like enzyme